MAPVAVNSCIRSFIHSFIQACSSHQLYSRESSKVWFNMTIPLSPWSQAHLDEQISIQTKNQQIGHNDQKGDSFIALLILFFLLQK